MNKNIKILVTTGVFILVVSIMNSCMEKDPSLGALPVPSFKSVPITPANGSPFNVMLINTTPTPGIAFWTTSIGARLRGDTVRAMFTYAGDYSVQLKIAGQGGIDSLTQVINVPENNPYAVDANSILALLSGAGLGLDQRTWMPERAVNTVVRWTGNENILNWINGNEVIGVPAVAFGTDDIADGSAWNGYFDDQYTFTFDLAQRFIYDDNKTVSLDGGDPLFVSAWIQALPTPWNTYKGTTSSTDLYNLVPDLKPWGSGIFTYSIEVAPAGDRGLGTITVNGIGAHIGFQDKTDKNSGAANQVIPTVESITYDILQISRNLTDEGGIYDRIIVGVTPRVGQAWSFMLKSYQ